MSTPRQNDWKVGQKLNGCCVMCGKVVESHNSRTGKPYIHCDYHRELMNNYSRQYMRNKRLNDQTQTTS